MKVGASSTPPGVSVDDALNSAGEEALYLPYKARLTGASNDGAKAKRGFAPKPLLWKPAQPG